MSNHTLRKTTHDGFCVEIAARPRRGLTGSRNVVAQARPVSPKSHELLANCISNNSDYAIFDTIEKQNRIRDNSRIDLWTVFVPRNIPCIAAVSVFSAGLKWVWRDIQDSRNGGHCLLTVGGWLRRAKIGAECVKYVWLSCPARLSGWVLCISTQCLRLKACHVSCDEYASGEICSLQHMWVTGPVMWAVASGASLKFGVQGSSATNWFSRVYGARDKGIRLYLHP